MQARASLLAILCAALLAAAGLALSAGIGDALAEQRIAGATPVPNPPRGKGERCVADTEFMRRNHMELLKHQRDETVHAGKRGEPFSLKECVACHAVDGPDGRPVTAESPQHFCRSCHEYAAVRVDCFECHASRPGEKDAASKASVNQADVAALHRYLQDVKR